MAPAPPPDFRYIGVEPGPSRARARRVMTIAGVSTLSLGLLLAHRPSLFAVFCAFSAAALAVWVAARVLGPLSPTGHDAPPISIVPWGVLVHAELTPRVLHWPAVREVHVERVPGMDQATPSIHWSVVTVRTDRETYGGRARGNVSLERLEAHLERYAREAGRPLALDLDGQVALEDALEPSFETLLGEARRLVSSGELRERLALGPRSYRDAGTMPCADTSRALGDALRSDLEADADARALAAVLAAELGETRLLADIAPLTVSPKPSLAAVARGAALRLGGDLVKVGALDEIADFVNEADLAQIRAWALGPKAAPKAGTAQPS